MGKTFSKKSWIQIILVQNYFCPKITFIKKKIVEENLKKKNLVKKILLKKSLVKKLFGKTKVFVLKRFGSKKNSSHKKMGKKISKKIFVPNNLGLKKFMWDEK